MKKINIFFVLECAIIVVLLAILGVLLKDSVKSEMDKSIAKEIENNEVTEEVVSQSGPVEVGSSVSGIVSVADVVANSNANGSQSVSSNESISSNSVSGNQGDSVSANDLAATDKFLSGKNMVVFGDSIWNDARGVDGISEHIQEETGLTIYNCAVGGSTAALVGEENSMENWSSSSFNGMIYVARYLVPAEQVIPTREAYDIIKQVDLGKMDYAIVAYGLNDFFSDVPIYPEKYYDITSYVGALRNGISKLKENYPQLKIIVVSPTYTKMFEGEKTFEIGSYVEAARGVAAEMEVEFLDMFHVLGNNAESRMKHLEDGVHMSAEGREVYADAVVWYLKKMENVN